jgi:hypothetical protein
VSHERHPLSVARMPWRIETVPCLVGARVTDAAKQIKTASTRVGDSPYRREVRNNDRSDLDQGDRAKHGQERIASFGQVSSRDHERASLRSSQ